MKYIVFTLVFTLILFSQLAGDPILPVLISEIYFEGDEWSIELSDYYMLFGNLDYIGLATSSDTAQFKSGIDLDDTPVVVNQDSMLTPLSINKYGDSLQVEIEYPDGEWVDICLPVYFGDYPGSMVNAPHEGQSLGRVVFYETDFDLVKNNAPSLGSDPYNVDTRGTFAGYVYDQQHNPVPDAQIHYSYYCDDICTDQNGYFESDIYGRNYDVKIYVDDVEMLDTLITIEPDSTTYCEFYIDLCSVNEDTWQADKAILKNYPNPFNSQTTISFSFPQRYDDVSLAIYNIKGQRIKQFRIKSASRRIEFKVDEVVWDGKNEDGVLQPPGFYFYSLEVDGKRIKTNKMIMVR